MSKTYIVIGDPHAHPKHPNTRADWIGKLIYDVRPDIVVNMGDLADMESLSSYDKGSRGAVGRSYKKDVEASVEFNDRMWQPFKHFKRKYPTRIFLIGNHEQRIDRALDANPELAGAVGYEDLQNEYYYDEIVYYNGNFPGVWKSDGINFAHFALTGISGRPVGGEHPAYSLITKNFESYVVGHSHTLDFCRRTTPSGRPIVGLVAGCGFDYDSGWAGEANRMYWRGVCILRNVENGTFDLETVSLQTLRRMYG